tara:strand:- start:2548 stop:3633 length:1086 start_codon:yes stop_codon:yes gene_type:complete
MKKFILGVHEKVLRFTENSKNRVVYNNHERLRTLKCKIDTCNQKEWEELKKLFNPYELIYTSSKHGNNICKINPVSRSYFKLHEMINIYELLQDNIYCSCLAEGPGGFINCLNNQKYNIQKVYGITLISEDKSIPYWNQGILNNKMNRIIFGKDNTGNLYDYKNVEQFITTVGDNKCHLVTADGGFDYSNDYNLQENNSYHLIYCEIYVSLNVQAINGNFIIKIFDLFNYKTIQLVYLLYNCYNTVEIYKPLTSRLSNSEKYIVCLGYNGCSKNSLNILKKYYERSRELSIDVPDSFLYEINKYNDLYVTSQINKIEEILNKIGKKDDINYEKIVNQQKKNAIEWCKKHNLPINYNCSYLK